MLCLCFTQCVRPTPAPSQCQHSVLGTLDKSCAQRAFLLMGRLGRSRKEVILRKCFKAPSQLPTDETTAPRELAAPSTLSLCQDHGGSVGPRRCSSAFPGLEVLPCQLCCLSWSGPWYSHGSQWKQYSPVQPSASGCAPPLAFPAALLSFPTWAPPQTS